jgi:hypothetical protein
MPSRESLAYGGLRPSGMTAIVVRSFKFLARYFFSSFLLGVLFFFLPSALLFYAVFSQNVGVAVALGLLLYVAAFFCYAAVTLRISYELIGTQVAWRQVRRRLRGTLAVRLFAVSIAVAVLWILSLVPFFLVIDRVSVWSSGANAGIRAASVLIILLTLLPPLYVWVSLLFALPVVVLESIGPRQAIVRSWRLVQGRRWEIAATLIIGIAFYVVGMIAMNRLHDTISGAEVLILVPSMLVYLGFVPWFIILSVLLYYDLRVRKEFLNVRTLQHQIT